MSKILPLNLYILLLVSLVSFLIGLLRLNSRNKNYFPQEIEGFMFKKILKNNSRGTTLGIYEKRNKKVIVKSFQGKFKNRDYYILKNEILVSQILTQVLKRISNRIPSHIKNIGIPKIVFVKENRKSLFVGSEFIESVSLKKLSHKKQIQTYFKVNKFLKFLGDKMTIQEKNQLSRRDANSVIGLYPLLVIKSLITNPSEFVKVIQSIFTFRRLAYLIHKLRIVLSHKDAHLENILITKSGTIYVIDLELALFSPELFDEVNTLRDEWGNSRIRKGFLKQLKRQYRSHKNISELIRVVAINVVMHGLTVKKLPKQLKKSYSNFLKHALHPRAFR